MIFDVLCDLSCVPKNSPHPQKFFLLFLVFYDLYIKHTSAARFLLDLCGYKNTTHHKKTTTQNTHASLLLYILKMALTIMASLAKVRRLFLLLVTLLLSRRVLKRTHRGRRRRRNGRRRNGRRKKITRVVV